MSTITFDTQELVRELRSSGLPQEQAEAVVRTIVTSHSGLVSREYFDAKLETLELRLTIKIGALMAAVGGIIIAVLRVSH